MSSEDKQYLVKLPSRIKIILWLGSSKILIYISQLIPSILFSGFIVVLLIVGYIKSDQSSKFFSNPDFAGLVGTLIGVFVGAVIGGIISLQLQKEVSRATSAINDKEGIYKYLYNGLMKFKSDIAQIRDRYHTCFIFDISDPRIGTMNPKFVEWDQIKNDSRIIQTPKWLRHIFEHYVQGFSEYQDLVKIAMSDIITTKKKLVQEMGLNYRTVEGLDEYYLLGVMNQNEFHLRHGLNFEEKDIKGIDIANLEQMVNNTCLILPSIEQAKFFYDNVLIKNTDEIISVLGLVIQYINNKYENQDDII